MQRLYSNKMFALTVKQLKRAELEYRQMKSQDLQMNSYQLITVVARLISVTPIEIKLTDQTDILLRHFYPTDLRKAVDPMVGKYYNIFFFPKRKPASLDFISFQIVGMIEVSPDQITIHMMKCMQEKLERQNQSFDPNFKDQNKKTGIMKPKKGNLPNFKSKKNEFTSINSKETNGVYEITKYCRELGKQFDVQSITKHFGEKYSIEDVENVLEKLSDKGLIMDLGLVYEWVVQQK